MPQQIFMEPQAFEQLLFRGESEVLDFKVNQYRFEGATDEDKSELLKDILAFANAWRDSDAHILIGVKEVPNGRSTVSGISGHLSDNNLQQFVNSKTQKPVRFRYEGLVVNGQNVAAIIIPLQSRPFFLMSNYGKLAKEKIYLRRGSSTDIATPDEIAEMGKATGRPKANFEIKTGFSIKQIPIPEIWLSAFLVNKGNATAYDAQVNFKEKQAVPRSVDYSLWTDKSAPSSTHAQSSLHPLHPGGEQHIISWGIGIIELLPGDFVLTMSGYKPRIATPVKYTGTDVEIQVTIFARDLSPVAIKITYSIDEIRNQLQKTFIPVQ